VPAKYGDPGLARAEQDLSDIPRPWTVPKMIAIFKKGQPQCVQEPARCESLARVLAASRDPRAAVALGDTFGRWYPDQALVIQAFFDYFVKDMYYGLAPDDKNRSLETGNLFDFTIPATTRWWNDNKARLQKESAALENHG
jgi:hypothetical protein